MSGNRRDRDSLSLSDLDLEDLGLRLELAITRAVQPEPSSPSLRLDPLATSGDPRSAHRPVCVEPAWSSATHALELD